MAGRLLFVRERDAEEPDELLLGTLEGADYICRGDGEALDDLLARVRRGAFVVRFLPPGADQEVQSALEAPVPIEVLPSPAAMADPLYDARILITRAAGQGQETAALLRRRGAHPIEVPTIVLAPPEDAQPMEDAITRLAIYAGVLFTSTNGVRAFFTALARRGLDTRALGNAKIYAIGPGTATELQRYGLRADVTAAEHRGEGLAEAVLANRPSRPGPMLLPRAAVAREALVDLLRAAGMELHVVEAYRSELPGWETADLLHRLLRAPERGPARLLPRREPEPPLDAILFTASSTAANFCNLVPDAARLLSGVLVASIGPITSETCRSFGLEVDVEAHPHTLPALIDALAVALEERR